MGKFSKIKKVQQEESAQEKMEWEAAGAKESSDDSSDESDDEQVPQKQTEETRKRAELWTNRERVLVLCSRGADVRTRYLMKDIKDLLPHAKGDSKLDQQKSLKALNEIAEMKNCTKVMYFESRKRKDTYLWMSNVEKGPSIKFLVHNVHTMKELKMSGNCLKASRPVLSFDDAFEQKPHLKLIKEVLMQTLGTPHHHPRSQPFVDHVFNFSVGEGDKIWFRNFQIVDESLQLQEVGPRFVLEMVRLFAGSFEGAVLYDNPNYVSPNVIRREHRKGQHAYIEKQLALKASNIKQAKVTEILAEKTVDLVGKSSSKIETMNSANNGMFCPACAVNIDDVRHVYWHFRYRRFPCGEQGCRREFYTEIERTAHATRTQHQESFRIIRVPYLDKRVRKMINDAKRLFRRRAAAAAAP